MNPVSCLIGEHTFKDLDVHLSSHITVTILRSNSCLWFLNDVAETPTITKSLATLAHGSGRSRRRDLVAVRDTQQAA